MAYKSIAAVAASANNVANPTALSPALPTRATGDLLVAITSSRSNSATVATPSGWTIWPGFPKASGTASGGKIYVFYRTADGSETSPAISWSGVATGTTGDSCLAVVVCFDLAEISSPSDVTPPAATDASAAGPSIPTLTTASANDTVVGIALKVNDTATTGTIANSFTERGDFHTTTGTGHQLYVATREVAAASTATGASAITESPTTALRCLAVAIAIKKHVPVTLFGALDRPLTFGAVTAGDKAYPVPSSAGLDDFNRANGAIGANWPTMIYDFGDPLQVISNEAGFAGFASGVWGATFAADQECFAKVNGVGTNTHILAVRVTNPGTSTRNLYYVQVDAAGNWNVVRVVSGAATTIDSFVQAIANGDQIGIRVIGQTVTTWRKPVAGAWTRMSSKVDAFVTGAGQIGMSVGASGVTFDDFVGGEVGSLVPGGVATLRQTKTGKVDAVEGADITLTFDNPTVAGNAIIVSVAGWDVSNAAITFGCSDNKGNTYSTPPGAAAMTVNNGWVQQFYVTNIAGGSSHQVTITSDVGNYIQAEIMEVSGLQAASALDASVENAGQAAGSTSTTNNLTATANDFVVAAMSEDSGVTVTGVTAGWTESFDGNTGQPLHTAYRSTGAGTVGCLFTLSGVTNGSATSTLALKVAAGGATTHYGVTALAITANHAVAGVRKTFGQVARPITAAVAVAGVRKTFGQVALPITNTRVVAGVRKTFGVVALPLTNTRVISGVRKTFSATAMPLTNNRVVSGVRRTFSTTTSAVAFSATTAGVASTGAATHFGVVARATTASIAVAGVRRTFSAVAMPLTNVRAVAGVRRTFGAVALPITNTRVVSGRRRTFGVLSLPVTLLRYTDAQVAGRVTASLAFGVVANITVAARRQTFGAVALPTVFSTTTQGARRVLGKVAMGLSYTATTRGMVVYGPLSATVLNMADAVYLGAPADAVYAGSDLVWHA